MSDLRIVPPSECPPVNFPAQCQCGHLYMSGGNLESKFIVSVPEERVWRPFVWCGFCRTRVNLKDVPWPSESVSERSKEELNEKELKEYEWWIVKHDGVEVFRGTDFDCYRWILNHQPQSVHWAIKYSGYEIVNLKTGLKEK